MAQLVIDCPHCGAKNTSMAAHGHHIIIKGSDGHWLTNLYSTCPHCHRPIGVLVAVKNRWTEDRYFEQFCDDFFDQAELASIDSEGFLLRAIYPAPVEPFVPGHLPEPAAKAFRGGEATFANPDTAEVSAMSFRRSVEMAIKSQRPDLKGSLAKRIDALRDDGSIPAVLAEWAHEVRAIGNDGAHEIDDMKPGDLQAIRGFAEAFLRYFVTLPYELAQRRAAVAQTIAESEP